MRRVTTTAGFLVLALLPIAAAVSPDAVSPNAVSANAVPPAPMPVAIAQPLTISLLPTTGSAPILPEAGLMILVGTGLMGLAAVVRRSTRA